MQLILQATHGVVSGEPSFFKRAFGDTVEEFENLLIHPQHFIFNRDWYEFLGGKAQLDEYTSQFKKLTASEKDELLGLISSADPSELRGQMKLASAARVKAILRHYLPLPKEVEAEIWAQQRALKKRVEDAGLNYGEAPAAKTRAARPKKVMAA
jgi:hypothetical protein